MAVMVCASVLGCAFEAGEGDIEGSGPQNAAIEDLGSSSEALLGGWATGPFTWSQGDSERVLEKVSTHVCALTRMSGKFRGGAEWVHVGADDANERWVIKGGSAQSGVTAEATCFPRSGFAGTKASTGIGGFSTSLWTMPGYCSSNTVETGLGDTFVFLQGLKGQLAGGGEFGAIEQSLSPNVRSVLRVQTCAKNISAEALSFRVGGTGRLATFMNAAGQLGDVYEISEFEAEGNQAVTMAPTRKAMCGFTRIQGKFMGGGEVAQIRDENGSWVLRTAQGGGSDYVRAHARCFARDQTG
jgi:hypothetical protein